MKRWMSMVLCMLMVLAAVGCGEEPAAPTETIRTVTTASTAVTAVTQKAQSGEEPPSADTAVNTTEATTAAPTKTTTVAPTSPTTKTEATAAPTSQKTQAPTKTAKPTVTQPQPPALTASLIVRGASGADETSVSESRKYRLCDSLFSFPIYLEADGAIANVDVYELELSFESGMYSRGNKKGQLGGMKDGDKAIVWLEFPGDFSAWCITYSTANGAQEDLSMYLSGEDGSLVVQEGIM